MTGSGAVTLIRDAQLRDGRRVDVRIAGGRIAGIAAPGAAGTDAGSAMIEARGGLLLPGLHDHHVHIAASAAALASLRCGPPEVMDAGALAAALAAAPGTGWLRGIGYHESIAGMIDRHWIDRAAVDRPVRIQHRSGRMWMFSSAGLDRLLASGLPPPEGLDRVTGRLFDGDGWMRAALGGTLPDLGPVAARWARWGVTGLTDMSPGNDVAAAAHFAQEQALGALPQRLVLAGRPELAKAAFGGGTALGPVKIHLHEAHLPAYDDLVAGMAAAHAQGRAVAVHCVTETELVFTLAAIAEAGSMAGDRIEHGSVAPPELVERIAALGLAVATQPNFVAERGDAYLADVPAADHPHLYRLASLRRAGIVLAGGTDTPFGAADPWAAIAAATSRRTAAGAVLGADEALDLDAALDLFLADPQALDCIRRVEPGAPADLVLLAQDREALAGDPAAADVRATIIDGILIHDGVDQPPVARAARIDPPAGQHQQRGALTADAAWH